MTTAPNNPYTGPRPFERGDTLFGRDKECNALRALLIAERILVLHSPSGAGKTSLIQAGLTPVLSQARFDVWPAIRVNLPLPMELDESRVNRYAFSVMLSLEEELPASRQHPPAQLAQLSLTEYLESRPRRKNAPRSSVLLFDQFEEILTVDPLAVEAKREFFRQLGAALENEQFWVLFSLREEYLAALEPYTPLLPTHLANTYRLDLLQREAAALAIAEPARRHERAFSDDALNRLLDDLATQSLQQPDGSFQRVVGHYIEPVQLQVVCYRLWQQLSEETDAIGLEHLQQAGNVNEALADYYRTQVLSITAETQSTQRKREQLGDLRVSSVSTERSIREWFDEKLISPQGIRTQVLKEKDVSGGLPNALIDHFVDSHLLRSEKRGGATWFELAHDRLIEPVKQNNAAWFEANLHPMQRQAVVWEKQGRSDDWLLQGNNFKQAKAWAHHNETILRQVEKDFLARSAEKIRLKILRWIVFACFVGMLIAGISIWGIQQHQQAKEIAMLSFESQMENAPLLLKADKYAYTTAMLNKLPLPETEIPLQRRHVVKLLRWYAGLIGQSPEQPAFYESQNVLYTLTASPDGRLLASGGEQGKLILLDAKTGKLIRELSGHTETVYATVIDPESKTLISGDKQGNIIFWSLPEGKEIHRLETGGQIFALALSPDGKILASGGGFKHSTDFTQAGQITLWEMRTFQEQKKLVGHTANLADSGGLTFSPDGRWLASGSADRSLRLWHVGSGKEVRRFSGHTDIIRCVLFHPDGKRLASSSNDRTIRLWNMETGEVESILQGHSGILFGFAFTENGRRLVSTSMDTTLRVWDTQTGALLRVLEGHERDPNNVIAQQGFLLSVGSDGRILRWRDELPFKIQKFDCVRAFCPTAVAIKADLSELAVGFGNGKLQIYILPDFTLRWENYTHRKEIIRLAFSADRRWLTSGDRSGKIFLWDNQGVQATAWDTGKFVNSVAFSPDSRKLVVADSGGKVTLADIGRTDKLEFQAHPEGALSASFHPNGRYLVSTSRSSPQVRFWDTNPTPPTLLPTSPPALQDEVMWATFSPDGQKLAAVGRTMQVFIYSWPDGRLEHTLSGHQGKIMRTAFSPDSRQLVTVSGDATLRFWDVSYTRELFAIQLPTYPANPHPSSVWDFALACTPAYKKCRMAVPLSNARLVLYEF
ncbi:MAG: WD40 repeat domain-containing protein [Gammaproteobacteria bacterium]|nr:WD40 repeat domain-containing protein [Gammaproteobacteria bacterium]